MNARRTRKSRVLEFVHEAARDLHEAGIIDKRRFEALCPQPIPPDGGHRVRALRNRR